MTGGQEYYVIALVGLFAALFLFLGGHLASAWARLRFDTWLDRRWQTGTVPGWARWVLRVRDGVWSA